MKIEPIIKGVVARSAHPAGCEQAIKNQIAFVSRSKMITQGPKRVLILGGSSGFGLASRIALTFGGAKADTLAVSFERGPSEKGVGSAGWYNNIYFKQQANKVGSKAINIIGDAFSETIRQQVIDTIQQQFDGKVDLIVYSLATGVRPKPNSDEMWHSAIKPIGETLTGASVNIEHDSWHESELPPASDQEILDTQKVMGGEDWESWIDFLINHDAIAPQCQTIAFSYIGPQCTHAIYHQGTLGRAKVDLHQTSHALNLKLAAFNGGAYACVCKALVTKASVFIPTFSPYVLALYRSMKDQRLHETCIEQMQRLFNSKLYPAPVVDGERLIRMDEWELKESVQRQVAQILPKLNETNFKQLGDYQGFKAEFMQLNGFDIEDVDYEQEYSLNELKSLTP
ncbi:enoyl-[acyl-carrier-protein] reductase [NADH] 2 [Vibrio inusitatus NBRC 102082]|uniref:Enoyl-[acyl-carrier-protein] reductase [NADH] n=1 Tax=Vibrio inusitatus NBRC 102082 TaxID=1219070 RepID=A0A4Y3HTI7_9VIBR|nr:enoyl-ACP reductase FabV [Vibrio inusitatus]GEA50396.1 enoyl-[acyl-carrier-protein] reductase [NADH] 2 [Vibrio inusitatus NBRC 102082]